jgi:hypothetical protein
MFAGQIISHADHDGSLAFAGCHQGDNAGAELALHFIGYALQVLRANAIEHTPGKSDAADIFFAEVCWPPPPSATCFFNSATSRSSLRRSSISASTRSNAWSGRHFQPASNRFEARILLRKVAPRRLAGERFDAANAGGHGAFRHDTHQADFAGTVHMRAAA